MHRVAHSTLPVRFLPCLQRFYKDINDSVCDTRVNEMNAETLLQAFLPYHGSQNFPRMLSILTLPTISRYHAPFAALIKSAQPLPRSYITTAISPERDRSLRLLNDVAGMVHKAQEEDVVHRALLGFWSSIMVDLVDKARTGKSVNEEMVKILVETFVTILSTAGGSVDISVSDSLFLAVN